MSEKRFICGLGFPINSDDPIRIISDSVEDKDYYKFSDICNVLNEQQATINLLLDLLYQSEETVIHEYSSHIGEDMDKLDKIFKEKDIKEIERFVRGCDDE